MHNIMSKRLESKITQNGQTIAAISIKGDHVTQAGPEGHISYDVSKNGEFERAHQTPVGGSPSNLTVPENPIIDYGEHNNG